MLKQTIKFRDLADNEIEEDFYFNLNKAEMAKLIMTNDDPEVWLQKVIDSGDGQTIIDTFEMFVKLSYGVKSEDGRRFIKTEEAWLDFYQSDAYSEFFMKLVTDAKFGAEFISGLMPIDLQAQVKAELGDKVPVNDVELPALRIPKDPKDLEPAHIEAMSDEDFARLDGDRTNLIAMSNDTLMAMFQRKAR